MPGFLAVLGLAAGCLLPACERPRENEVRKPVPVDRPEAARTPSTGSSAAPHSVISAAFDSIQSSDAEHAAAELADLRAALSSADGRAAAGAVNDFLRTRRDVRTGQRFSVGPDGVLAQAPTFRLTLMDLLPGLDPDAALDAARATLAAMADPDECALALRNVAWNDLDGDMRDELRLAFERVMTRSGWSENPSAGYLEALDIGVELGDAPAFGLVSQLLENAARTGNDALLRASFIALDRMAVRDPLLLSASLEHLPAAQRAALMARLDPSQPPQRELLVTYLTRTDDPDELAEFTALFPNGNRFHGNWLVTTPEEAPSITERWRRDREILAALETVGPGLPSHGREIIETVRRRLKPLVSGPPPE